MKLELIHAGRYAMKQRSTQTTGSVFIGLSVSGLEYSRTYYPSGRLLYERGDHTLHLIPEGFRIDFSYSAKRENYVIACRIPELSWNEIPSYFELPHREGRIRLPFQIAVSPEKCLTLRGVFERIIQLEKAAVPTQIFAAEQLALSLLAEFAASEIKTTGTPGIAERLRRAIDADAEFRLTLAGLCRNTGCSPGHARRLFWQEYHIEPGEYRARKRLNRIMNLLAQSQLSPKEIAEQVGMKHVTHLYVFLKNHCGMTPGELRRQYQG